MLRVTLVFLAAVLGLFSLIAATVVIGMHRLAADEREAVAARHGPPESAAATQPAVPPNPEPDGPPGDDARGASVSPRSVQAWAKDALRHGAVQLLDGVETKADRRERAKTGSFAESMRRKASEPGHQYSCYLTDFRNPDSYAEWRVDVPTAGNYSVDLNYSSDKAGGRTFVITVGTQTIPFTTDATHDGYEFHLSTIVTASLPVGPTPVKIASSSDGAPDAIRLRCLRLDPARSAE